MKPQRFFVYPVRFVCILPFAVACSLLAQDVPLQQPPTPPLAADENDPGVIRAHQELEQTTRLVQSGALPLMRLRRANDNLQEALDLSILKKGLYRDDLLPDQVQQIIFVAQRMVVRRERILAETRELAGAGVLSRAEAEATELDLAQAKSALDLANQRALMVEQIAINVRLQKAMADAEGEALAHPDQAGKTYFKFDGTGGFSTADRRAVELAFAKKFSRPLPVSADGETALHRSFGFDHRGRVDVALTPDQPEGIWLLRYLESKGIPYFAFRTAVPHQATGAHIHMGPGSTRLAAGS